MYCTEAISGTDRTVHHLHTRVESNVGTIATTGTDNMIKSDYSVVDVVLDTGRKHQIRTQLSHRGHPIYGDIKWTIPHTSRKRGRQRYLQYVVYCTAHHNRQVNYYIIISKD
jgi:23S rRNA-/tRNA-specific pseudouridylate synthase